MVELRRHIQSPTHGNHEDSKQLVTVMSDDFCTVLGNFSICSENLQNAVVASVTEKGRTSSDLHSALVLTHD